MMPAPTSQRHRYEPGPGRRTGSDGRVYALCRLCGGIGQSAPHRGYRQRPPAAGERARRAERAHRFEDSGEVRLDRRGHRLRLCAICARPIKGHTVVAASGSGSVGPHPSSPAPEIPEPELGPLLVARPWQLDALISAADQLLTMPELVVGWSLRVRLIELRATVASLYPGIAPADAPEPPVEPEPIAQYLRPSLVERPPSNPRRAARKLRRGLTSPQVRALFDAMIEQGWSARAGSGSHLRMTSPSGEQLTIPNLTEGNPRGYRNLRAQARRLGVAIE